MQTTYRFKAQEIGTTFIKSLQTLFAGQEVEITVRTVEPALTDKIADKSEFLKMTERSRLNAPVISADIDIRAIIDESQSPD